MQLLVLMLILTLTMSLSANAKNPAQKIFNKISKLSGEWEGTYSNGNHHNVSYKLISNNTALVEIWTMSPSRKSMTIYTVDGDRLLASHFCPKGNQPRLILTEHDSDNEFQFSFLDGVNLHDPNGSHQHSFWLRIESSKSFTRSETYISNAQTTLGGVKEGERVTYHRTISPK